jgi:hypothetical protein
MATRVQVTSATHPPGESPPAERWWQTPAVVAAVSAGMAAILVAIIGLGAPKSKPSAPMPIEPQPHGPNSPAAGGVGGNVHVTLPPRDQQP